MKKMSIHTFRVRKTSILTIMLLVLHFGTIYSATFINYTGVSVMPFYIETQKAENTFPIAEAGRVASIYVDPVDWKGVIRATNDLSDDIQKVTGVKASVEQSLTPSTASIIIGTVGKSQLIDKLIADKKIDVSQIEGKWESFVIQTVDGNLVIAGSDKRGTIYGIYDVSEKIGVSPWYWWADVPVRKSSTLYVKNGRYLQSSPKVKYRGIFINDEEPSFGGWANAKFGGSNSKMYSHIFELLLRLKANYLWPAMWGKSFNEDDPMNPCLADEYGIVMGTSHHEPMMRSHKEYTDRKKEIGAWDYTTNKINLDKFFREGLDRNKGYDNLITIGMRGDGDVAMGNGRDEENIQTLKRVVEGQRNIIQQVYQKDPSQVPQLWAIFTEVQRYYDAGFTVPDDVLLLFCDNNWGYIRRTGPEAERKRKGGLGMYYHIDMNGGPWNDRWINTTTLPKLREQFNLAYQTGIDGLWVVNVGDLKPKELPVDFIMRYAWNPDAIPADKVFDYTVDWAANIFGKEYAVDIADIVSKYSKYNLWRKPEVQATNIFSYVNYHEADSVLQLWKAVVSKAESIATKIPPEAKDAYYQLVLYPVKASAGVAEIYIAAGKNNLYARQGRVSANDYAKRVRDLFEEDKKWSDYYNDSIAGGKWKNMMSDVHIGYTEWSMPSKNSLPGLVGVQPFDSPTMGVALEGTEDVYPISHKQLTLPVFDNMANQSYYVDVFNKGKGTFQFKAKVNKPWIKISSLGGTVEKEFRVQVSIDWNRIPNGESQGIIEIKNGKSIAQVQVNALKAGVPNINESYFGRLAGEYSIPANKFSGNIPGRDARWVLLPDLGRSDACMGISPVTALSAEPETSPRLEYKLYLSKKGKNTICLGVLPTQDISPKRGLRIAVGVDNQKPKTIDARKGFVDTFQEYTPSNLSNSEVLKPLPEVNRSLSLVSWGKYRRNEIFDNLRWLDVNLDVDAPGIYTLKVYMVDPEVVFEKIVINPDNEYPSYFGAPSFQNNAVLK